METGKVQFAPDYKSKSKAARLAVAVDRALRPSLYVNVDKQQQEETIKAEYARLQTAVVEAAKAECAAYSAPGSFGWTANHKQSQIKLRTATRALISFEAEHKIGE